MKRKGFLKEHSELLSWWLRLSDLMILVCTFWLAMRIGTKVSHINDKYFLALAFASLISFSVYPFFNLYRAWRGSSLMEEIRSLLIAWTVVFACLAILAALIKVSASYSRLWFALFYVFGLFGLVVSRLMLRFILRYFRNMGLNTRSIVIVGAGDLGHRVADTITKEAWTGLKLLGFFSEEETQKLPALSNNYPVLGGLAECANYIRNNKVDQVWICLPLTKLGEMKRLFVDLDELAVDLRFVPDIFSVQLLNHSITEIAGLPIIDLSSSPMDGVYRVVKSIEDKVLATVILILILPVITCIAIVVKVSSPGPIIFKQKRYGINGEEIRVYKFRSMSTQDNGSVIKQATKGDRRVTAVGAFLRRTSLDELPQFFNVLQGRMSIVGPRPHAVAHNEEYKGLIGGYMKRHLVKPGITGWAQINGWRGETDTLEKMEKRVEFDLYYIENWSLWFDLKIILLTVFKGFSGDNVY